MEKIPIELLYLIINYIPKLVIAKNSELLKLSIKSSKFDNYFVLKSCIQLNDISLLKLAFKCGYRWPRYQHLMPEILETRNVSILSWSIGKNRGDEDIHFPICPHYCTDLKEVVIRNDIPLLRWCFVNKWPVHTTVLTSCALGRMFLLVGRNFLTSKEFQTFKWLIGLNRHPILDKGCAVCPVSLKAVDNIFITLNSMKEVILKAISISSAVTYADDIKDDEYTLFIEKQMFKWCSCLALMRATP